MLSQQSKYALRALQYLQKADSDSFLRVEEIAAATDLPAPYLAKVLKSLVQKGLLSSRRGKNGGVALVTDRKRVTFYEVCQAVDDPIVKSECVLHTRLCSASRPCAFHERWSATKKKLLQYLEAEEI
jgi:Rrf2 family protein